MDYLLSSAFEDPQAELMRFESRNVKLEADFKMYLEEEFRGQIMDFQNA